MTTAVMENLYTVEEFLKLEWPDDDDNDYELIGGRIMAKPQGSTSGKHGEIAGTVLHYLKAFGDMNIGQNKLGRAYVGASCNLGQIAGKNFPKPDVCFVLKGRTPDEFEGPIPVAPDLVIEVNSPSDTEERRFEKLQAYQQAEVSLIWSIHMLEKYVLVYRKDQPYPKLFTLQDELDGGTVLPGFMLKVSALFQ